MLRRVVSHDRLDRGIYTSASSGGKGYLICVGCPCFWFWFWLTGALFSAAINMNLVLSKESDRVLEVSCSGSKEPTPDALHHLTGCTFKREFSNETLSYRMTVGGFEWQPSACGAIGQRMKEGKLASGVMVSFLGNASGGLLKPWVDDKARVCSFADGVSPGILMVQKAKTDHAITSCFAILCCFFFLIWASSCAFFPDKAMDGNEAQIGGRAGLIALGAICASCFVSGMQYFFKTVGMIIAWVIVFIVLYVDVGKLLSQQRSTERVSSEDPSEETPLLPHSAAHPGSSPQVAEPSPEPAPSSTTYGDPEPEAESTERPKLGSSGDLMMAIALGIAGGLLVGLVLSGLLYFLTSR